MSPQAWFISGANRGIGLELVKAAANKGYIVFAGARTPAKAIALKNLVATNPNIHILQLESTSVSDIAAAAKAVKATTGGLDVVIANAGILQNGEKAQQASVDSLDQHFEVNAVGPLLLFQALYSLLANRDSRKFITVSSAAGSIALTAGIPVPLTVYGASKAALNFITQSIHKEHKSEGFIVFPIHPGMVTTDMGNAAKDSFGDRWDPITPKESADSVFKVVEGATKEQSGRFLNYDGSEIPW